VWHVGRPRQIACQLGHPFTPANTRLSADGSQQCLVCARRRSRDWQRRHRAHLPPVDDKPGSVALIIWSEDLLASWTYHRTHEAAVALAPTDAPWTVVDVARKPWIKHPSIGKGEPMNPKELARLQAAVAANDKPLRPHPGGLRGRTLDALDDLALLQADPNATLQAKRSARMLADAMIAALRAETGG
jgi:hypothetical protein